MFFIDKLKSTPKESKPNVKSPDNLISNTNEFSQLLDIHENKIILNCDNGKLIFNENELYIKCNSTINIAYSFTGEYHITETKYVQFKKKFDFKPKYNDIFLVESDDDRGILDIYVLIHNDGQDCLEWIQLKHKHSVEKIRLFVKYFHKKMEENNTLDDIPNIKIEFPIPDEDNSTYKEYLLNEYFYPFGDISPDKLNILTDITEIRKNIEVGIWTKLPHIKCIEFNLQSNTTKLLYCSTPWYFKETPNEAEGIYISNIFYAYCVGLRSKNILKITEGKKTVFDDFLLLEDLENKLYTELLNNEVINVLLDNFAISKIINSENGLILGLLSIEKYLYSDNFPEYNIRYNMTKLEDEYLFEFNGSSLGEFNTLENLILKKIKQDVKLNSILENFISQRDKCAKHYPLLEGYYPVPEYELIIRYILYSIIKNNSINKSFKQINDFMSEHDINTIDDVIIWNVNNHFIYKKLSDLIFSFYYINGNINKDDFVHEYIRIDEEISVKIKEIEKINEEIALERELLKNINNSTSLKENDEYTIEDVDKMNGIEFENFLKVLFEHLGYKSKITQASQDQGIDLILVKNSIMYGVQAKNYSSSVGNKAVQEVIAGSQYYNCDKSIVVTNNYFTGAAKDLAKATNVKLWDRDFLMNMLELASIKK